MQRSLSALVRWFRIVNSSCELPGVLNDLIHYNLGNAMKKLILISAFLFALPITAQDAPQVVGRVLSAQGRVEIVQPDGERAQALRRAEVSEADTLETDQSGTVQIKLLDSAILILGCNSSLKIDQYKMGNEELVSLHLVRGHMRTLTGTTSPEKYRLNVGTANTHVLISSFGTDFEVIEESQGNISFGVYDGGIEVHNNLGSVALGVGEQFSYSMLENGQPPIGVATTPNSIKEPACEIF